MAYCVKQDDELLSRGGEPEKERAAVSRVSESSD
jgi:hypothetical protein